MKDDHVRSGIPALNRRDIMKIGAGVVVTTLSGACKEAPAKVSAQEGTAAAAATEGGGRRPRVVRPEGVRAASSGPGFKYTANRRSGNGPMDETTRRIVSYVTSFSEAQLTPPVVSGLNKIMVDAMTAMIGSFGSEVGQICARLAKQTGATDMKSTVAGYGLTTTPEAAAFANCFMVRQADYNDGDPPNGGHASVIIPGVLAVGEALHSTGPEVLAAVAIAYEFLKAARASSRGATVESLLGWGDAGECCATALGCGKLLGLEEDRLANALSLALVSHLALGKGDGTQSHFKAGHSAIMCRHGVFSALAAREGLTGPNEPFEGLEGLFDSVTGPLDIHLPVSRDGRLGVENFRVKRYPAEGNAQAILHQAVPPAREWAKNIDDIESIHIEMDYGSLKEIASPECWDPSNRETADHSMPYMVATAMIDGEVYLSSFTPQRYLHDEGIRAVMAKITCEANPDLKGTQGRSRLTVRKKNGEVFTKTVTDEIPISYQDVLAKFDRVCGYMSVPNAQRDQARAMWSNLMAVKDIAEPMRMLGHFGPPLPLTGGTPRS